MGPKSNFSILVLRTNLEPFLAGILAALERHVDRERHFEIHENCAVVAVADFKIAITPAQTGDQLGLFQCFASHVTPSRIFSERYCDRARRKSAILCEFT